MMDTVADAAGAAGDTAAAAAAAAAASKLLDVYCREQQV
jgi:hypothetical protein